MSDDYEALLESFIADLRHALQAAGTPSYSQLEQASVRLRSRPGLGKLDVLARSTTHEILSGRRTQPPKWRWVMSFVTVLHAVARDGSLPADRIGTFETWKRRHEVVCTAAVLAAKRPASVGGRHRKLVADECASSLRPALDMIPPQRPAAQYDTEHGHAVLHGAMQQFLRPAPAPRWWHSYRDIAPEWLDFFLFLESAAEVIRTYEPQLIPGLLQVETYAGEVLRQRRPETSAHVITRLVQLRIHRQEMLAKPDSSQLWAVVDEAALRNGQVGRQTMRSQITHLLNTSEQPNITIQILRSPEPDDHVAIKEPITIFRLPDEHLDDVVFLEQPGGYVFLSDRSEVEHYSQLMSRLAMRATATDEARNLLHKIFTEL